MTLCFARGLPASTPQGTAAMLEEQDVTRSYLVDQNIPVPAWRTFLFSDSIEFVTKEIEVLGYPVTLRPAWRNSRSVHVSDPKELGDAVQVLQKLAGRLASRMGRPQSRYMVERSLGQSSTAILVSHGDALSATRDSLGGSGISADVSGDFYQLAIKTVAALPGIQVASVQIIAEDVGRDADVQAHGVSWLSAEPRLNSHNRANAGLGVQLADQIIERESGRSQNVGSQDNGEHEATMIFAGVSADGRIRSSLDHFLSNRTIAITSWLDGINDGGFTVLVRGSHKSLANVAHDIMRGQVPGLLPLRVELLQGLPSQMAHLVTNGSRRS